MKRSISHLVLLLTLISSFAIAQQRPTLTMQWALGEAGSNVAKTPKALWLQDGTAILYNERLPLEQRTFERFDPATGKTTPALNVQKALASLNSAGANDAKQSGLDWPEDFDVTGNKAAYIFGNDAY